MHTSGRYVLKLHLHVIVTEMIIRKDGEEVQKGLKKKLGTKIAIKNDFS
jgi:hypothetical protein